MRPQSTPLERPVAIETKVFAGPLRPSPSSHACTALAHSRPSLIAQTIKRLAAARVARGEDAVDRGEVAARGCIAARVPLDLQVSSSSASGPRNPIASRTSSAGRDSSVPGDELEGRHARVLLPVDRADAAASPAKCVVEIENDRSPPSLSAYDVRSFIGQRGHGVRSSGRDGGRLAEQLDLGDRGRPLPVRLRHAVGARVAAADHHDVLARRGQPAARSARDRTRAVVQVLHREVHAVELPARHRQVARNARAGRDDDGIVALPQLRRAEILADVHAEAKLDTFGDQLLDTPLHEALLDLELGHTEAHEAAGSLVALVDDDVLTRARELLRAGEPGRARTDDCDAAPGPAGRRLRGDPTLVPAAVDDRELHLLDRDGVPLVDLEHARRLARRRTEPAGELREVVRAVQLLERLLPAVAVDEVVPVGDQVPERAAVMAERDTALHAAGRLLARARRAAACRRTRGSRPRAPPAAAPAPRRGSAGGTRRSCPSGCASVRSPPRRVTRPRGRREGPVVEERRSPRRPARTRL